MLNKPRVLVVDDDEMVATTTSMILNASGFESVAAFSGARALELACTQVFDVLLTDVIMTPMNGIELAVAFLAIQPDTRVLLTSGTVDAVRTLDALDRCCDLPLLEKPIAPRDLISRIHNAWTSSVDSV